VTDPELTNPSAPTEGSAAIDFRRADRLPQSQIALLHSMHEDFARTLAASLSLYLRTDFSGSITGVRQLSYDEHEREMATPTCLLSFRMEPYQGQALVELTPTVITPILDLALGGNGKPESDLDRQITEIEEQMLEGIFGVIARDLSAAWRAAGPIHFSFAGLEKNRQSPKGLAANEAVTATGMELRLGDKAGKINLAIPSIVLRMVQHEVDPPGKGRGGDQRETIVERRLAGALKLEVECALTGASVRLRDLLALKPGDVIDLGMVCDGAATILVNGIPKFQGEVTTDGAKQAVLVKGATC
jgi:flagellar motor switch protein FliM